MRPSRHPGTVLRDPDNSRTGRCEGMTDSELQLESALIDTSDIDLVELRNLPDSALKAALLRFREENSQETDIYAGFDSAI